VIDFFKRLFVSGQAAAPPAPVAPPAEAKPPIPDAELAEFKQWYLDQRKPAVALVPTQGGAIGATGSRLGGPAWLAEDEAWPVDRNGVPLEFLAQLDLADCGTLDAFPRKGILQFFVGRDDVFGADFDDLRKGSYLVRHLEGRGAGKLHSPPTLEVVNGIPFSEFSPFTRGEVRDNGVALSAEPIEDRIDYSIKDAEVRIHEFYRRYDTAALEAFLDDVQPQRPYRHHAGGFPAFAQSDIRHQEAYADYDRVLLRLTSDDDNLVWGDTGEAVFMIRSADLAAGDFSAAAYSWDCL